VLDHAGGGPGGLDGDGHRDDGSLRVHRAQQRDVVDAVEQRHDRRSGQECRRSAGQCGEQIRRLDRDEQDVDGGGQPRPGRHPCPQLAVPVAPQDQAARVDGRAGAVRRQQGHVVAGLREQRPEHAADRARAENRDLLRHDHSFVRCRHRSRRERPDLPDMHASHA
jgi:hypothetical protein